MLNRKIESGRASSLESPTSWEGKRKRCKRYDNPGEAHALTFSCYRRQPFLRSDRACRWFLDALEVARGELGFEAWAYVIMPEHVHLIVFPGESEAKVSEILLAIKRPVARKANWFVSKSAPHIAVRMRDEGPSGRIQYRFWQRGGGYDRNLVRDATVYRTIDYIHANPVRRGLVEFPEDWKWSSAAQYAGSADVPFLADLSGVSLRC
ncbi:MAG: transposase [Phycisphaerae bacterium]|nr:transposase [Phycisphaerae bacterium]